MALVDESPRKEVAVGLVVVDDEDAADFGDALDLRTGAKRAQEVGDHRRAEVVIGGSVLRPAEIDDRVDPVEKLARCGKELADVATKRRGGAFGLQILEGELAVADDGVKRRAQVMAKLDLHVAEPLAGRLEGGAGRVDKLVDEAVQQLRRDENPVQVGHHIVQPEAISLLENDLLVSGDRPHRRDQVLPYRHQAGAALEGGIGGTFHGVTSYPPAAGSSFLIFSRSRGRSMGLVS